MAKQRSVRVGDRFNRWTIHELKPNGHGCDVIAKCDCGTVRKVSPEHLKKGNSKSCGCFRKEYLSAKWSIHGGTKSGKFAGWYQSLKSAQSRCHDPNNQNYEDYGGRGICVFEEWRKNPKLFLEHMGERPEGFTLERINNELGYVPGNVKWASRLEQARNRRPKRFKHTRYVDGLAQAARNAGLPPATVSMRVRRGWSVEEALTTPVGGTRK